MTKAVENFKQVQQRIKNAALRSGRDPENIKLVAVTKMVPVEEILPVIEAGGGILAENRVQELLKKQKQIPNAEWHLIGHLQTNKAKKVAGRTTLIHSLNRWSLVETLHKIAKNKGIDIDVLVQVNISGEKTKHGLAPEEVTDFIASASELGGLNILGLMTMAPHVENPEEARPVFRKLYQMRQKLREKWPNLKYLSMGMTNDFEVAVEEGANIVRIGSAIFRG